MSKERVYTVDLADVYSADGFHQEIIKSVPVPTHYGKNLDALNDALTSIYKPTKIIFKNTDTIEVALPKFMISLRKMCKGVQESNPNVKIEL